MHRDAPVVALVGATGAAGGTLLRVLRERVFPAAQLRVLASEHSAGSEVAWGDERLVVRPVDAEALRGVDIAFFAAGASVSRTFGPGVASTGGVAVDKSSAFRLDPRVPLVVPEVNPRALDAHHGIVANPNCVTIPLALTLAPLHAAFGLRHVTLATYQAASGAGRALAAELAAQTADVAAGLEPHAAVYPHVLQGNVVPGGWPMQGDATEEEAKVTAETRRVLGLPALPIAITTVRVPVSIGHSAAVWVELGGDVTAATARQVLASAPGLTVLDDPATHAYPTPRAAAGTDSVLVGRIRRDGSREHGLAYFFSADNLRRGAATNAVMVAELLLSAR